MVDGTCVQVCEDEWRCDDATRPLQGPALFPIAGCGDGLPPEAGDGTSRSGLGHHRNPEAACSHWDIE